MMIVEKNKNMHKLIALKFQAEIFNNSTECGEASTL